MKILVTGGAGFIGSHFIRLILSQRPDWQVVNLDALTYAGCPETMADFSDHPSYQFIEGDITDPETVKKAMASCSKVVHFAAESHVDRSITGPQAFTHTNIFGTQVLMDQARSQKIDRFLLVSTDEVYGDLGPHDPAFTEDLPLTPSSPYSASKAAADLLLLAYVRTFDFPGLLTRCSNNYGPYQFPEKLIPLFAQRAARGEKLPVYGDGQQIRDWLYVEDHCTGILAVLEKGRVGQAYNLGGECEKANLEITERILHHAGQGEELIEHVADRPGHDRRYAMNIKKVQKECGWSPAYTFDLALTKTLDWYRDNPEWVQTALKRNAENS